MNSDPRRVEPLQRVEQYPGSTPAEPWHRSARVRVFAVTAGLVLVLGLIWTLMQPVVYRSSATVLMSAPIAIDAEVTEVNIQNVAIQRRILLGSEITGQILETWGGLGHPQLDADYLAEIFSVEAVRSTNLVELVADGADAELLPLLVNSWIDIYLEVRATDIEHRKLHSVRMVQEELDGLAMSVESARDALEAYRQEHQIISVQREENEVLSKLDGLNKALNTAVENEVNAGVYLETIREALSKGKMIVPRSEMTYLQGLEDELRRLNDELVSLNRRYTTEYINKQPRLRAIPERIAELEKEKVARLREGGQVELAAAQQAHSAAERAVVKLQRKLDEHKQAVALFNRTYATHEALEDDLARLEEIYRESQARLVQMEVRRVEKYPQVDVIERPAGKSRRVGPDYLLILGATFAAALVAGIVSAWLYGFLGHRREPPAYVTLTGVHMYSQEATPELAYTNQPDARLAGSSTPLLEEEAGATGDMREDASPGEEGRSPE